MYAPRLKKPGASAAAVIFPCVAAVVEVGGAEVVKAVVDEAAWPVINVISERKSKDALKPPPMSSLEAMPQ